MASPDTLQNLTVDRVFPDLLTDEAEIFTINSKKQHYHDVKFKLRMVSTYLTPLVFLVLAILRIPNWFQQELKNSGINDYYILLVLLVSLIFILYTILILPLDLYYEHIERIFGFSTLSWKKWLRNVFINTVMTIVIYIIIFICVYTTILFNPEYWWFFSFIILGIIFTLLMAVLPIYIMPLFTPLEPFPEGNLSNQINSLVKNMGLQIDGIYLRKASIETTKPGASVTGIGKNMKIILDDTLIKKFRDDEISIVVAHELAHIKNRDLPLLLLVFNLINLFVFFLVNNLFFFAINWFDYSSKSDPASVAFFFFAWMFLFTFLAFILDAFSRWREKKADLLALSIMNDFKAYKSGFLRLADLTLSYPDPSKLEVFFTYSHPPIKDRIKYGEQFKQ